MRPQSSLNPILDIKLFSFFEQIFNNEKPSDNWEDFEPKFKELLYYPSSGFDIGDLLYFNPENINSLGKEDYPRLFIHSDYLDHSRAIRESLYKNFRRLVESSFVCYQNNHEIHAYFYKFRRKVERSPAYPSTFCVLLFLQTSNEIVLTQFLKNGVKVKYLYTACDGITHGMGDFSYGYDLRIATIFFGYLYGILKVQYHIYDPILYFNLDEEVERYSKFKNDLIELINRSIKDHSLKKTVMDSIEKNGIEKIMEKGINDDISGFPINLLRHASGTLKLKKIMIED